MDAHVETSPGKTLELLISRGAKDQLKSIIERIERLDEEKKTISDDIRDVYAEAKGNGFDVKALRTIVRMRKQDAGERAEQETILETYNAGVGDAVMAEIATISGDAPQKLAQAVSDAFFASGLPVDEAACVAIAVIADYARAEYGDGYLIDLADIVILRGGTPMPESTPRQ
jgi:uncharacterized protein (UPF0335 family)